MQYFKNSTEYFDDSYHCIQKEENECNLLPLHNWMQFFVSMYNDTVISRNNEFELINGGECILN
jgi:hypothetical protein